MFTLKITEEKITLPEEVLAKLGANSGDRVCLIEVPGGYRIESYDPDDPDMLVAKEIMEKDREILRRLAE